MVLIMVIHLLLLKHKKMMNSVSLIDFRTFKFLFFLILGFDPCSLFMSALASDIEDERRPLPSTISYRPTTNSYNYSSQYTPTTNSSVGPINPAWLMQQQQQQQQYQHYHDSQQSNIHTNGTTPQKQQQHQQQQQRYPVSFSKTELI
jgi:hypothetical protein